MFSRNLIGIACACGHLLALHEARRPRRRPAPPPPAPRSPPWPRRARPAFSTIPLRLGGDAPRVAVLLVIAVLCALAATPAQAAPASVDVGRLLLPRVSREGESRARPSPGGSSTARRTRSPRTAARPRRSTRATRQPGATYSFTFTVPGRYKYICLIHPGLMDGVVQVGPDTVVPRSPGRRPSGAERSVRRLLPRDRGGQGQGHVHPRGQGGQDDQDQDSCARARARWCSSRGRRCKPGRYRVKLEADRPGGQRGQGGLQALHGSSRELLEG